ncbi:uncharacterized protein [Palaemon carinicauda]|uniref:uncharacterized protein n=1 Tax=Palaemon carinicauda TaxID=392227 RepID=UPI0035B583B4
MLPPLLVVAVFFTSHLIPGGYSQEWRTQDMLTPTPAGDAASLPYIRNTANAPREFFEGDDMLLTCVVSNLGNHTVWWSKYEDRKKTILTVADSRIVIDDRVSILHDRAGGDVWVLVVKNVKVSDNGVYVCEVNSQPSLTSRYMVTVVQSEQRFLLVSQVPST